MVDAVQIAPADVLANVRVVLVNTSHPGNIGAAARAMKNMGIKHLMLVDPRDYPADKATWRAASAADVLESAVVVNTLAEAVADCGLVLGASARSRTIPWTVYSAREAASKAINTAVNNKVALVFGREDRGLTNEELQQCQIHLNIPTSDEYSSLNLAMAVQVACYEMRMASMDAFVGDQPAPEWDIDYASSEDNERLYQHLEKTMTKAGFYNPEIPKQLPARMRRWLGRSRMDQMEVNIMRGFLAAVERKIDKNLPE
jgi:tRNA (cytidine32/uridine32-2'-O)-methyltransferase